MERRLRDRRAMAWGRGVQVQLYDQEGIPIDHPFAELQPHELAPHVRWENDSDFGSASAGSEAGWSARSDFDEIRSDDSWPDHPIFEHAAPVQNRNRMWDLADALEYTVGYTAQDYERALRQLVDVERQRLKRRMEHTQHLNRGDVEAADHFMAEMIVDLPTGIPTFNPNDPDVPWLSPDFRMRAIQLARRLAGARMRDFSTNPVRCDNWMCDGIIKFDSTTDIFYLDGNNPDRPTSRTAFDIRKGGWRCPCLTATYCSKACKEKVQWWHMREPGHKKFTMVRMLFAQKGIPTDTGLAEATMRHMRSMMGYDDFSERRFDFRFG